LLLPLCFLEVSRNCSFSYFELWQLDGLTRDRLCDLSLAQLRLENRKPKQCQPFAAYNHRLTDRVATLCLLRDKFRFVCSDVQVVRLFE
jgi:hypothetical protein